MSVEDGSTHIGRRRAPAPQGDGADTPEPAQPGEDPSATRVGRRRAETSAAAPGVTGRPEPSGADEIVRFGPGVPGEPQSPSWTPPTAGGRRRSRPGRWVGAFLTLAIVVGVVLYLFLRGGDAPTVRSIDVRADPAAASCDATVDVIGTIVTDGSPGTLRYQWIRSDGQTSEVLAQTVASGVTSTQVRLQWTVTGQGWLDARATLRVLDPAPSEGVGRFTYTCS
ncbi:hypothetical protein [Actinomycetospora flava]|uniref:Ig-like domain-containing protein n=1 Tax=Actinomycetospora flava TaxID=3129232 RepID=A0ABU8MBR7_9PSEU